jgi:hypothetical protein
MIEGPADMHLDLLGPVRARAVIHGVGRHADETIPAGERRAHGHREQSPDVSVGLEAHDGPLIDFGGRGHQKFHRIPDGIGAELER